jgi:NAD(P)-dependent dehydrogenase (short-subunit alcohol dehydrogenase family)
MRKWSVAAIPSLSDRTAVVTGTGGLGYETALALVQAGANVVIAGRNAAKGEAAVRDIRRAAPGGEVRFGAVDLASLRSVQEFSARMRQEEGRLDLLINNAGVMMPPARQVTADGFELQFGTNHLGHVALTAGLMPLLRQTPGARVVALSSIAARQGAIHLDDPQSTRTYQAMVAYSQSKLACLMFALELQRRSVAAGWGVTSLAAHPGIARTDLLHNAPGRFSAMGLVRSGLWFLFQPVAQGALPTLYAATAPEAVGGGYYGPNRLSETRGAPAPARIPPQALDEDMGAGLWQASVDLTGATFG